MQEVLTEKQWPKQEESLLLGQYCFYSIMAKAEVQAWLNQAQVLQARGAYSEAAFIFSQLEIMVPVVYATTFATSKDLALFQATLSDAKKYQADLEGLDEAEKLLLRDAMEAQVARQNPFGGCEFPLVSILQLESERQAVLKQQHLQTQFCLQLCDEAQQHLERCEQREQAFPETLSSIKAQLELSIVRAQIYQGLEQYVLLSEELQKAKALLEKLKVKYSENPHSGDIVKPFEEMLASLEKGLEQSFASTKIEDTKDGLKVAALPLFFLRMPKDEAMYYPRQTGVSWSQQFVSLRRPLVFTAQNTLRGVSAFARTIMHRPKSITALVVSAIALAGTAYYGKSDGVLSVSRE